MMSVFELKGEEKVSLYFFSPYRNTITSERERERKGTKTRVKMNGKRYLCEVMKFPNIPQLSVQPLSDESLKSRREEKSREREWKVFGAVYLIKIRRRMSWCGSLGGKIHSPRNFSFIFVLPGERNRGMHDEVRQQLKRLGESKRMAMENQRKMLPLLPRLLRGGSQMKWKI